jgi:hypothetical protein
MTLRRRYLYLTPKALDLTLDVSDVLLDHPGARRPAAPGPQPGLCLLPRGSALGLRLEEFNQLSLGEPAFREENDTELRRARP